MVPHKLSRGRAALGRLRAHEGVPPKYAKTKLTIVPNALRVARLNPRRKYCTVGRLSHEVGWKYQNVISTLEARRLAQASLYHAKKKRDLKLMERAKAAISEKPKIAAVAKVLESYGYAI
jgi:large subunit ribosomal protein L13Ae